MRRKGFKYVTAVVVLTLAGGLATAQASVISAVPNTDLTSGPITIDFADPADPSGTHAIFSFLGNNDGIDSSLFTLGPTASVKTNGVGLVAASHIAAVPSGFSPDGSPFFDDSIVPDYQSFDDFVGIPPSRSEIFLALALDFSDGRHFGYAKLDGSTLFSYGYETVPGLGIEAGAQGPQGPSPAPTPVPGPDSLTLFALGIALIGFGCLAARRRPSPGNRGLV